MATKYLTNVQFVKKLMECSSTGALMQVFIIEAINDYSHRSLAAGNWPENYFINQEAWKRCATEALKAINERPK